MVKSNRIKEKTDRKSIRLTPSQAAGLEMLSDGKNLFVTGKAGTGKSFLISQFLKDKDTRKEFPVLASTGAAAVLIGGRTFHSFFGLGRMMGTREEIVSSALKNRNVRYRLRRAEAVVIDEVSMLPKEALVVAEEIARKCRLEDAGSPWGGLRVVVVGDFAQLPPVSSGAQKPWAFMDPIWSYSEFHPVNLEEIVRTQDQAFLEILGDIRMGKVSDRVRDFLNTQKTDPEVLEDVIATRLYSRRDPTEQYNLKKLDELPGESVEIITDYTGRSPYRERLQKEAPIAPSLLLKENALVMIRINDPQLRYVNGTLGRVIRVCEDFVSIDIGNRIVDLEKTTFSLLSGDGKDLATATNFPISLAWASTIHKAQGATLNRVVVDLRSLWEPGHAYVALSRVRQGADVMVTDWSERGIRSDPVVRAFYQRGCPYDFGEQMEDVQDEDVSLDSF